MPRKPNGVAPPASRRPAESAPSSGCSDQRWRDACRVAGKRCLPSRWKDERVDVAHPPQPGRSHQPASGDRTLTVATAAPSVATGATRPVLRAEVWLVFALSLGASGVGAL